MALQKKQLVNRGSILLDNDENNELFAYLHSGNFSLAAGVVQLLEGNLNSKAWILLHTGVVMFCKDCKSKCYVIRLMDLYSGQVWQCAITVNVEWKHVTKNLIAVDDGKNVFGLNFASIDECQVMFNLMEKLRLHTEMQLMKKKYEQSNFTNTHDSLTSPLASPTTGKQKPLTSSNSLTGFLCMVRNNRKEKRNRSASVKKRDISSPRDFKQLVTIKRDEHGVMGFKVHDDVDWDSTIMDVLRFAGFDPTELCENEREIVHKIVREWPGGVAGVRSSINANSAVERIGPVTRSAPSPPKCQPPVPPSSVPVPPLAATTKSDPRSKLLDEICNSPGKVALKKTTTREYQPKFIGRVEDEGDNVVQVEPSAIGHEQTDQPDNIAIAVHRAIEKLRANMREDSSDDDAETNGTDEWD